MFSHFKKSYIVLHSTLRSMTHFLANFCIRNTIYIKAHFFYLWSCSSIISWKGSTLLNYFWLLSKLSWAYFKDFILDYFSVQLIHLCIFLYMSYILSHSSHLISIFPTSFSIFKIVFAILVPWPFYIKFQIILSISIQNLVIFIETALNLYISFRKIGILTFLSCTTLNTEYLFI